MTYTPNVMAFVEVRYLDGSSVQVKSETVGGIMVHIANLHQRFAPDVAVVCPDSGRDLTDPPSQIPPSLVQVVVKPEAKKRTIEELRLTLHLHAEHKDFATCVQACAMFRKECGKSQTRQELIAILDKVARGDIDLEAKIVTALVCDRFDRRYLLRNACMIGNESRVKMLLSKGVPVDFYDGWDTEAQPLSIAAKNGQVGTVNILLAQRADVNHMASLSPITYVIGTPLMYAAKHGYPDVVRILLNHRAEVDAGYLQCWPLGVACSFSRVDVAEILLSHRADPNYQPVCSGALTCALFKAACSGNPNMVKLLVAHAANINIEDENGDTVLFMVEQWDSIDIAKALIDCGANIHHKNKVGFEPLLAVVFGRAEDVMKLLLDHRADVNQPSYSGQTPLMAAVFRGRKTMVKMLLANKANVNHQAKNGETALAVALEKKWTDLVEILRDHGAIVYCNSSDNVLADASEGESRDCLATSANKRRKENEDGAGSKDICVSENDFAKEEKEKKGHEGDSRCSQDKKNKENDDVSGWETSTSKDMKMLVDEQIGNSSDNVLAHASEGESRDCKATSANKRRKENEDRASSKDICVSENDFAKEKRKKEGHEGDFRCNQGEKNKENDDVSGWGTSTSKDMEMLDDNKIAFIDLVDENSDDSI